MCPTFHVRASSVYLTCFELSLCAFSVDFTSLHTKTFQIHHFGNSFLVLETMELLELNVQ